LFDIIFLEGKSLLNVPLDSRRKILEKVVNVIPNRILLSKYVLADGTIEDREVLLSNEMKNSMELGLEGLVLKDIKSIYEPNARHWIKIKKDYLKGMADSADLIVLGAYYGTGSKGGKLSTFLMGLYDEKNKIYKTVCKCGNGHDDETIDKLNEELIDKFVKIQKDYSKLPDWLKCDRILVPDFYIEDPQDSVVWEISGAEFSKSTHHTADGISIRFPRVTKIRDDKAPKDATTLSELKKLFEESKKKGTYSITRFNKKNRK